MKASPAGSRIPVVDTATGSGVPVVVALLLLVIFAFVATHAQARVVDVVEFYSAGKDHYFITSVRQEVGKLDRGEIKAREAAAPTLGATNGQ